MLKFLLLATVALSLNDCGMRRPPKPEPLLKTSDTCPAWIDGAKGKKTKLADEIDQAPADAVWPEVLVTDQGLKDQMVAAKCPPVN